MLTASSLSMSFGGQHLFSGVSFSLQRGDRLALVGPNGAGKSTLFSLLLGHQEPDEGAVSRERGATLGWLPQETATAGAETVLELACAADGEGWSGEPATSAEEDDFSPGGGTSREAKAKRMLAGLAFRETDFHRPARELSGGWIMRAHLARLLVQEPDLLLLDEPTNHLDLESLGWFQSHLQNYRGAILLISHDREFLNQLTRGILELRGGRLHRYRGNYNDYLREKAARQEQQIAAYKNQQKEIQTLQRFADRFRAKASKASQAQSKLRQIERMEKVEAPEEEAKTVRIRFPQPPRVGQIPLRLEGVHFSYGDLPVYRGIDFECERGDRIALVGPNGAGKSTLLKLLGGILVPVRGQRVCGYQARTGYYSQNRLEMLQTGRTVIEEALAIHEPAPEQMTRTVLGSFLFSGDAIFKKVDVLSGGEKSRLGLVKLLLDPPNVLLLDEPTTHLDMASIDALVEALRQFEGTIIFISHDVYFIRSLATKILHINAGKLTPYAGGYDYYLDKSGAVSARAGLVAGERPGRHTPEAPPEAPPPAAAKIFKTKEQKRQEARERQERAARRREAGKRVTDLESEIAVLEKRQEDLTEEMENPATYEAGGRAMELNRELLGVADALERLQGEWEEAAAELEKLRQD